MSSNQGEHLSGLLSIAKALAEETEAGFGGLTVAQLNWKPDAGQWSIAQCLEHLLTANASYFPTFDQILSGEKKRNLWERLPLLPAFWGKMVLQAVSPETARKLKAPKIYRPASSSIDGNIVRRFTEQQSRVIGYMQAMEKLDLEKIIMSSPVHSFIPYSLLDAYRITVAHEQRHLLQAKRVLEREGFPRP